MNVGNVDSATSASNPVTALRNIVRKASNSSGASAAQSAAQEFLETNAQTKAEAAKGDVQAKLKLAREEITQAAQQPMRVKLSIWRVGFHFWPLFFPETSAVL